MVKRLNSLAKDRPHTRPFEFQNNGSLAYIGDWKAIYDRTGGNGDGDGVLSKETGRVAWLLWRSAYFTMTLSWRNKSVAFTHPDICKLTFWEGSSYHFIGSSIVGSFLPLLPSVVLTIALGIFGRDLTRF